MQSLIKIYNSSRLLGQWTAIFRLNTWGIQGFSSFHLQPSYFPKALVLKPLRSCVWRNEHVMGVSSGIHLPNTVDFNDVKKHIGEFYLFNRKECFVLFSRVSRGQLY